MVNYYWILVEPQFGNHIRLPPSALFQYRNRGKTLVVAGESRYHFYCAVEGYYGLEVLAVTFIVTICLCELPRRFFVFFVHVRNSCVFIFNFPIQSAYVILTFLFFIVDRYCCDDGYDVQETTNYTPWIGWTEN